MKLEQHAFYRLAMEMGEEVWKLVTRWDFFAKQTIGEKFIRAADSVAAHFSQGYGRDKGGEKKPFCSYSMSALYETKTWLAKAYYRALIDDAQFKLLETQVDSLVEELNDYIKGLGSDES